jgi:hypothetical protein
MPVQKKSSSNHDQVEQRLKRLLDSDPYLNPYEKIIRRRLSKIAATKKTINGFSANGHHTPNRFF